MLQENQQKEGETGAECGNTLQRQNLQPKLGQLKPVVNAYAYGSVSRTAVRKLQTGERG